MKTPAKTTTRHSAKTAAARRSPTAKPAKPRAPHPGASAILAVHKSFGEAIRKPSKRGVDKLLASQFSWIDERGAVHSRADVMADLTKVAPTSADTGVKVRDYGRVATVSGKRRSAQKADVFFVEIWVKGRDGWCILVHQDNVLAHPGSTVAHPPAQPRSSDAKPPECANPLQFVPHTPRSQAEHDIIASFQALERAVTHNDHARWVDHMADEFVVYRTRQHPATKAARAQFMAGQRAINAETWVAEVERMKLWVHGDVAVMRADHKMPGNRRPPYRATRVWVKRGGRWQMAMSQQTTIAAT